MQEFYSIAFFGFLTFALLSANTLPLPAQTKPLPWMKDSQENLKKELVAKYGDAQKERLSRGLNQVAQFWLEKDGDAAQFEEFVRLHFAGDRQTLDVMFTRFEYLLEKMNGHMTEISREFRTQADLDLGPIYPFDQIFAGYDISAHVMDDFFANKLAFTVLLNFPLTTLEQRLTDGKQWTRRQWAETRLAQYFSKRIPAEVNLTIAQVAAEVDQYISEYNIYMHHVVDAKGNRLFPAGMRLLSHWNLRDEIKAQYANGKEGLARQRMIHQVMDRIVTQTIPQVVVNNPHVDWDPVKNSVAPAKIRSVSEPAPANLKTVNDPEPNTRYAMWWKTFQASRTMDPYSPTAPTLIARRFDENREIPEERVKAILESVTGSPLVQQVAKLIEQRLGRPLEPFDIWYNGFKPRSKYTEPELDAIVSKRYPTPQAYKEDMPNMLVTLGFAKDRAEYLARYIEVDPARGSGHAMGAGMRGEKARLRTRIDKTGMNYKGFNIAVHEMGHNVEQTLTLNDMDHYMLSGVPNTAFTEAMAFVFQSQDLRLLGLESDDPSKEILSTLNDFWATYEIAGVALTDMEVWHWMYDNPNATPAQLKESVLQIAKNVWNKFYAPVFKKKDVPLLAIYSHMVHSFLYTPDYPLGHLIAHQIEEHLKQSGKPIGTELERMLRAGNIAPDLWMANATGSPVGAEAMLAATERALKAYKKN